VALTSLWSRRDALAPWPSPLLDPRGPGLVRNVEVDCLHAEFLTKAAIYAAIRRELAVARSAVDPAGAGAEDGPPDVAGQGAVGGEPLDGRRSG